MKKGFSRKKSLILILIAVTISIIGVIVILNIIMSSQAKPLLKVVVSNPSYLVWGGEEERYIVDTRGRKKKYYFVSDNVESYRIDDKNNDYAEILIDSITRLNIENNSHLYETAYAIIELIETEGRIKNPDIYKLYVLGGRYFFDVIDSDTPWPILFSDSIYEYNPENNSIIKIATFYSKNIDHIELFLTSNS